jgi:hypothetical protein
MNARFTILVIADDSSQLARLQMAQFNGRLFFVFIL